MDLPTQLSDLVVGQELSGFETQVLYIDDSDRVLGARFLHGHTGFVLDLLQLETAPQGFISVYTPPVSDRGEPHTQEHLLLGKGNKGRAVATQGAMALVESSAFTSQLTTAYHLHTTAGSQVFLDVLHDRLDALLNPDYADEEIAREVHNFGVSADAEGQLHLEEKGTVYNEMVSSYNRPWGRFWRVANQVAYGTDHPMSRNSGGLPSAIREMTPAHIRDFHAATHHLGNMALIAVLPTDLSIPEILGPIGASLISLQPEPTSRVFATMADLPAPRPELLSTPTPVPFPAADAQQPTDVLMVWPAGRELDLASRTMLDLYLDTLAGAENSNLYRRLVDSETRQQDLGATEVYAWVRDLVQNPIFLGVGGIPGTQVDAEVADGIRAQVVDELNKTAGWSAGDPALADFNRRALSRLTAWERELRKWVGTPPRFGVRGTGSAWFDHLRHLHEQPGERLSLTLRPQLQEARAALAQDGNIWTGWIEAWGLLEQAPAVLWRQGDAELLAQMEQQRQQRLDDETALLVTQFGADDDQAALEAYRQQIDAATAVLEAAAVNVVPPLVDAPPLTEDDPLDWTQETLTGGVTLVRSHFSAMSGASVGLALDLRGTHAEHRILVGLLPVLLTDVGVRIDGVSVPYDQVLERVQNEILDLSAWLSTNSSTGRVELVIEGSGTSPAETTAALEWVQRTLLGADWTAENLARIRDVVDERVEALALVRTRSEETWVQGPATAWRYQHDWLLLSADSFQTKAHDAHRVQWMLRDAHDALPAVQAALEQLAAMAETSDRAQLALALAGLQGRGDPPEDLDPVVPEVAPFLSDAAQALARALPGLPDSSLAADWRYLCRQMSQDLATPPGQVLADLVALRDGLLVTDGARLWAIGAVGTLDALDLEPLLGSLSQGEVGPPRLPEQPLIRTRLAGRGADSQALFLGLTHPDGQGGVHLHSAPGAKEADLDRDVLLDYLTGLRFAGHGSHSLFMKTWAAGLAYSNGVRPSAQSGLIRYYAERTPELQRTLGFVIDELALAQADEGQTRYALAQAFHSRSAVAYETRGRAIASDLVDGRDPETIRAFRTALLALAEEPGLPEELQSRHEAVYGRVLPGYGPPSSQVEGGVYFVIGPEDQLVAWERYLAQVEGDDGVLVRLYDRDFWVPALGPR
jgi:Zn-dependent M16 (insulinase) family peptidase